MIDSAGQSPTSDQIEYTNYEFLEGDNDTMCESYNSVPQLRSQKKKVR